MAQTKEGAKKIKETYGRDIYKKWGRLGGNPVLIQQGIENRTKQEVQNGK